MQCLSKLIKPFFHSFSHVFLKLFFDETINNKNKGKASELKSASKLKMKNIL